MNIGEAVRFSNTVKRNSYESSSFPAALERFLALMGMRRGLFDNLAQADNNQPWLRWKQENCNAR